MVKKSVFFVNKFIFYYLITQKHDIVTVCFTVTQLNFSKTLQFT